MQFFNIEKLSDNVTIKIYDDIDEFKKFVNDSFKKQAEFFKKQGKDVPCRTWDKWISAMAGNGKIDMLNIELTKTETAHKNANLENTLQVAVHELVHICHAEISKKPLPAYRMEGIATQLANQKYYQLEKIECNANDLLNNFHKLDKSYHSAYTLLGYMREKFKHEELLEILSGEKEPDLENLITETNLYLETKNQDDNKKQTQM
ncbi:MAG: hypothetical protein IJZ26_03550 [Clostridia bacterium]|nr:hypothetical protein [Clostridia bacterium]